MFKKILAVAMATAMVFSVAQIAPANTPAAKAAAAAVTKTTVGSEDCSTGWWTEFSDAWELKDGQQATIKFENHSSGANGYNNFVAILVNDKDHITPVDTRPDTYFEYAVVRSDLWGWSDSANVGKDTGAPAELAGTDTWVAGNMVSHDGKTLKFTYDTGCNDSTGAFNWDNFLAIIKDSNVTVTAVRVGDVVKMTFDVVNIADPAKKFQTTSTVSIGSTKDTDSKCTTPVYLAFTVDGSYMKNITADISAVDTSNVQIDKPQAAEPAQTKKTLTLMESAATTSKVTGELTVAPGKVTVKAGSKTFTGTVKGKTFTVKLSGVKAGTKLTLTIEKDGYNTLTKTLTAKGTMKLSKVKVKKNTKKITGTVSQKKATVKIKVGKKKYKKAKVKGKKFTLKCAKLKKGTKVTIKVTKKNYKTLTKSYKAK